MFGIATIVKFELLCRKGRWRVGVATCERPLSLVKHVRAISARLSVHAHIEMRVRGCAWRWRACVQVPARMSKREYARVPTRVRVYEWARLAVHTHTHTHTCAHFECTLCAHTRVRAECVLCWRARTHQERVRTCMRR